MITTIYTFFSIFYRLVIEANNTETSMLAVIVGIYSGVLLIWSLILLNRSGKIKNRVRLSNRILKEEISKREDAASELHLTHQQLSTTTGHLDGLIEGTTDYIAALDTRLHYISFNESYKNNIKSLFGVDLQLGMSLDNVLAKFPENLGRVKKQWEKALAGNKFSAEQVYSESLSNPLFYELTFTPIKDKKGMIIGAAQICRDVTENKLYAEKLKSERDFVAAIFDINSSLIIVLDREGRIVRFNQACEKISGYLESEVKGRIFWNILVPTEQIKTVKSSFRQLNTNEFKDEHISKWISKDETVHSICWNISPIKDENDTNEFLVATGIDITEKRKVEKDRRRMLEILENSTDFISIWDIHGHINFLNPTGREMLGISKDEDISKLKIQSCHPHWTNELLQAEGFPTAYRKGTWLGETALKTLDNKEIPTSQLILSHKNKLDEVENYSTVIRDISRQKSMESNITKVHNIALENTKIKTEFFTNMSHEIRTPMNGIVGISDLLLTTELDEQQTDYVQTIQNSGDALLKIINDILDISKLESGKLTFEKVEFDLTKIIESTLAILSGQIKAKKLEICLLINREVPDVLIGDPGRLRQILTNLISNAVKFTNEGEIFISVEMERESPRPVLKFSIKDNGIGIAEDIQNSLFTPFTQADASISRNFGGTGLGLQISKQLVELMHGKIGVKSEPHKGSTFWFTIELETPTGTQTASYNYENLKNIKALIVDDNKTQRDILLYQAKSLGMLADDAGSDKQALEFLKTAKKNGEDFQIIFIDSDMSDVNGFEFAARIKDDISLKNLKIVMMVATQDQHLIAKAGQLGLTYFVNKPVLHTAFYKLLNKIFITEKNAVLVDRVLDSDEMQKLNGTHGMSNLPDGNARILIAEDDLVSRKVILNQVAGLGYDVDIVETGKEVIDALQLKDYSVILMDCQMPVMNGFDTTTRIRENEAETATHIPIIAVTANAIDGDREKCLEAGMDDYISKPTKQQILAEKLQYWLNYPHIKNDFEAQVNQVIESDEQRKTLENVSEVKNIEIRLDELNEVCGVEVVLDCINLFLADTENIIKELNNFVEEPDMRKLAGNAHKLKGSSSNMGATRLPGICQNLIEFAKNEQTTSTKIIMKQVSDEYAFIKTVYSKKKAFYEKSLDNYLTVA